MEYKNIQEIIKEENKLIKSKLLYEKAIENAKKTKRFCDFPSKFYWSSLINKYKVIVKEYKRKIQEIELFINNLNTFPKEIFLPFILECINLNEEEEYFHRNIVVSQTSSLSHDTIPSFIPHDIIFPESILEEEQKIEQTFYISILQMSYQELFEKSQSKYIMTTSKADCQLISSNLNLLVPFKNFPYLQDIGINLIERKLKEPNKSNIEILNDELEEQKEITKKKIKS